MRIFGVDFTSAPRRAKPITVACGSVHGRTLHVEEIEKLENLASFEDFLNRPGPWVAGFDFPFGLPRDAIIALEAYPGHLAKGRLGIASYKSDDQRKQTPRRLANRRKIVETICKGEPLGIRLSAGRPLWVVSVNKN